MKQLKPNRDQDLSKEGGDDKQGKDVFLDILANAIIIVAEDLAKREIYGNMDIHGNKAK